MLFKLAIKNIRSRKSSIVIIMFIAFAIMLFCVANAIFDSTEQGVEESFISSFTGDLMIRPKTGQQQTSLFGDESPVTGELAKNENIVPYEKIKEFLRNDDSVAGFTSQLSGYAMAENGKNRMPVYLFGVNAAEYLSLMPSLQIKDGESFDGCEKSVMLYEKTAADLGVKTGDSIQFTVADGISVRIREAVVTGIYTFKTKNSIFEKYALVSADVLRGLLNINPSVSDDYVIDEEKENLLEETDDLDSFFDFAEDFDLEMNDMVAYEDNNGLENIEPGIEEKVQITSGEEANSNTWNFIVCRLNSKAGTKKTINKLNSTFKKNNWPVEAVAWRNAAGSTALYLYWIRIILNVGIVIILIAGFIIINNTLVINILDRSREIGTMRAIGAKRWFISTECMLETVIMAVIGGLLGILAGIVVSYLITKAHIHFGNAFLQQLFGSEALKVRVTAGNGCKLMLASLLIGVLGWIYPVRSALKINPVQAMQGAK